MDTTSTRVNFYLVIDVGEARTVVPIAEHRFLSTYSDLAAEVFKFSDHLYSYEMAIQRCGEFPIIMGKYWETENDLRRVIKDTIPDISEMELGEIEEGVYKFIALQKLKGGSSV